MNITDVQKKVLPEIEEMLKKEPESISSLEKKDGGWIVQCEVLEKKSVPAIFDILKVFEFKLDSNAKITGFKQLRKVRRGDIG